ncbi:MAG: JAB domain-containing protein [Thermodesulfobacteriota bacterium]|nr:JAB domain-containing protein [Thermodesulfobacteriota bacterium]
MTQQKFKFSLRHNPIYAYRINLVREKQIGYGGQTNNSKSAAEIARKTIVEIGQSDRENLVMIALNTKNEINGINIISQGGLSSAPVYPREVFKPAILMNAAAVVISHNHPSGDINPSQEDKAITKTLVKGGNLLGIIVHDHIIVNADNERYFSFRDNQLM